MTSFFLFVSKLPEQFLNHVMPELIRVMPMLKINAGRDFCLFLER